MLRYRPPRRRGRSLILPIALLSLLTFRYFVFYMHDIVLLCPYLYMITTDRVVFDNILYSLHHYPEFVCPQNFRNLADWVYGWPENEFEEELEDYFKIHNSTIFNLPDGSIIYVKTNKVPLFFTDIYSSLKNKFVLITSQGDHETPGQYLRYLEEPDSKIIHWFGQNGDIRGGKSDRFTHIPLGINCYEMAEGLRQIHQQYPNSTLPSISDHKTEEPSRYIQPFDISQRVSNNRHQLDKLVLVNFDPHTDTTGLRMKLWASVCGNNSKPFIICFNKSEGVNISHLSNIYKRNRQYPLWLSPRGGGLDCHRTWEALYLDIIPVVWHSTLDPLYENLPIIVIKDSNEINEQFLRDKLREISMKKVQHPSVYQYEKLRNAYWRKLIMNKSRYSSGASDINNNRCWRGKIVNKTAKSAFKSRYITELKDLNKEKA